MCLDRKIEHLETELERLRALRNQRDEKRYISDKKKTIAHSASNKTVNYFPLILVGLAIALLLAR